MQTISPHTITGGLLAAELMPGVGPNRQWRPVNSVQDEFLTRYFPGCAQNLRTSPPADMEFEASRNATKLNEFARRHGFTAQFAPFERPDDFGMAAAADLTLQWQSPGTSIQLPCKDGLSHPGVLLGASTVSMKVTPMHPHPIAEISTKQSRVFVYMTMLDEPPPGPFGLLNYVEDITLSVPEIMPATYEGLIFPKIDADDQPATTSWAHGMSTVGDDKKPVVIVQALFQNILQVNHLGTRARSLAMFQTMRGAPALPVLVIDGPFLFWVRDYRQAHARIAAHFTYDVFRDPGDDL